MSDLQSVRISVGQIDRQEARVGRFGEFGPSLAANEDHAVLRYAEQEQPTVSTSVLAHGRILGEIEEFASASNFIAVCETASAIWCRSFGVSRQAPRRRLTAAIVAGLVAIPSDALATADINDAIHGLAREAIERWFVNSGFEVAGRDFDRLRHRFLMMNRNGLWSDHFLCPEVNRDQLAAALGAVDFVATPALNFHRMARQSL